MMNRMNMIDNFLDGIRKELILAALSAPPQLKTFPKTRVTDTTPGSAVLNYVLRLASDKKTVFAQSIDDFITCTIESKETKPSIVMSNIRQFMSGMKNYLVMRKEQELTREEEQERIKLKHSEVLNFNVILNEAMYKLIISPLKTHLMKLFVNEYTANGAIQLLGDNITYAKSKSPHELGIREKIVLPSKADMEKIYNLFHQMQAADSPKEKLEILLNIITVIYSCVKILNRGPEEVFVGADDFLPIFVWVLVQTGMVTAEIEADYIWGLLHSSLLCGEGEYYLTTLSSAVNILKNFKPNHENNPTAKSSRCYELLSEFQTIQKTRVRDKMNGIASAPEIPLPLPVQTSHSQTRTSRPTSPNRLNSISTTTPTINRRYNNTQYQPSTSLSQIPPPPPRWAKPSLANGTKPHNVAVTAMFTFTINNKPSLQPSVKMAQLLQSPTVKKAENPITDREIIYVPLPTVRLPSTPTPLPKSHTPYVTFPESIPQTPQTLSPVYEDDRSLFHYQPHTYQGYNHYEVYDVIDSRRCNAVHSKFNDYQNTWRPGDKGTFGPPLPPRPLPLRDSSQYEDLISSSPQMSKEPVRSTPLLISEPVVKTNRFGLTLDASDSKIRPLTLATDTIKPVRKSKCIRPKVISQGHDELLSPEVDELLKKWVI